MKRCVLWSAGAVFAAGLAAPARAEVIPPEAVVAATLAYARSLQMADDDTRAAAARERQARALAMPSVSFDGRAAGYQGLEDATLAPGVVIPGVEERFYTTVAAAQPLFTGGRIPRAREAAGHERRAAEAGRRAAEGDLALAARRQYWAWAKARGALDAYRQSVHRIEAHTDDVRRREAAGLATDRDRLTAEVRLEQTRLQLQGARRAEEVARARLGWLTGREPEPADEPYDPRAPLDRALPADDAPGTRPELEAANARQAAARAQTELVRADARPQASLVARYEYGQPNVLFFPPEREWNDDVSIALNVSWSVWDGRRVAAQVAEAAARADRAGRQAEQIGDDIRLELREAGINLRNALERMTVAERALDSARRNQAAASDQWKAGLARHAEFLDAESDLADATYEVTAAAADIHAARAAFQRAMGRKEAN